jgi:hypothetical protein
MLHDGVQPHNQAASVCQVTFKGPHCSSEWTPPVKRINGHYSQKHQEQCCRPLWHSVNATHTATGIAGARSMLDAGQVKPVHDVEVRSTIAVLREVQCWEFD